MNIVKKILNGLLGSIVLSGLLIFFLRMAGIEAYTVLSGSMEPCIPTGGIVFVNTWNHEPREGDLITYHLGSMVVTHRVVQVRKEDYITKGDANPQNDMFPVLPSHIMGTVCFSLPYLGYIVSFFQTKIIRYGIYMMVILSFLLQFRPVFSFIKKRKKESAKEVQKRI